MKQPVRIALFTGNRADYALLHPLIVALRTESRASDWLSSPALWVGGNHLSDAQSAALIAADGWESQGLLVHRLDAWLNEPLPPADSNTPFVGLQSVWHQQAVLQGHPQSSPPDALIVLGDRYEAMGVTLAAFQLGIPVLQLAAGDTTEGGTLDDGFRDAITALARWKAAFSPRSYERLVRWGHSPETLLQSGSLSVDNALATPLQAKEALCEGLQLSPTKPLVLFTQHPVAAEGEASATHLAASLEALWESGVQVVATPPNADAQPEAVAAVLLHSQQTQGSRIRWVPHLGRVGYLSWLAACDAVVGNTSSGLYESPLFGKPCLNIGNRQAGREQGGNVLNAPYGKPAILAGLATVLQDATFRQQCLQASSPFGNRPAAPQIVSFLRGQLSL